MGAPRRWKARERERPLYICICNALPEKRVREAVATGCRTIGDVYNACGTRPQCGKCGCAIADMIRARRCEGESLAIAAE